MKKLYAMILLAVVLFAACTHENDPVVKQIVTIQASIAHDSDSRVALGETEETKVNWTEGDKITLEISGSEYEFTWQEGTTFAYLDSETPLPELKPRKEIVATYVSSFSTNQTGLKADVGNYMELSAYLKVESGQGYENLNFTFSHGTSVLKLTLSNDAFKGQNVTDITLNAGSTVVVSATGTFQGDAENGSVTAYLAIQPGTLENVTLHATCNGNTYTDVLDDKTIVEGKLYTVNKTLPYAYVDLGLPSGTKWASFNVGATSAEGYGDYFAWGETEDKAGNYDLDAYKYLQTSYLESFTKYCHNAEYGYEGFTDNLTTLEPIDDAATANWGSCWRMPTKEEMEELLEKCKVEWTIRNEVNGYLLTSLINDKSIFLPAAGMKIEDGTNGAENKRGYYWSSSLNSTNTDEADILLLLGPEYGMSIKMFNMIRNVGNSVRPVYDDN